MSRSSRLACLPLAILAAGFCSILHAAPNCQASHSDQDIVDVEAQHALFQIRGDRLDVKTTDRGKAVVNGRFYVRLQNGGCLREVAVRNGSRDAKGNEWNRILLEDDPGCSEKHYGWGRLTEQVATVEQENLRRRVVEMRVDTGRGVYYPKITLGEQEGRWQVEGLCM